MELLNMTIKPAMCMNSPSFQKGEPSAYIFGPFFSRSWGVILMNKVTGYCVVAEVEAKPEDTVKLK